MDGLYEVAHKRPCHERAVTTMQFKVGDRVACYGQPICGTFDAPSMEGDRGTVIGKSDEWLTVKLDQDYGSDYRFHPKQCRRLGPPKKREWNILYQKCNHTYGMMIGNHVCKEWYVEGPPTDGKTVTVQEVKQRGPSTPRAKESQE